MSRYVNKNVPWVFYSLVATGVLFLFGLWFFLHPNSPWHSRNHYLVAFEEIGNLRVNNAVKVNGLTKGYVEEFKLTDSCVWAKIAVLSEVKVPLDSKLRIMNVGLMGERVIEITLGNSKNFYKNGAHIVGGFDMGSTTIGMLTMDILDEVNYVADVLSDAVDYLSSNEKIENYKRLGQKAKTMGNRTSSVLSSADRELTVAIDSLIEAGSKIEEIMDNIKPNFDGLVKNANQFGENFKNLENSLEKIESSIASIADKLERGNNTISLALDKNQNGALRDEMAKVAQAAEQLMEKIKKRGLDLNVDIF